MPKNFNHPLEALHYHVSGAIERGEGTPIIEKRRPMQHHEACQEVSYIMGINPCNPGSVFNHDPECFARYRKMQADHARASGHKEQARQMLADPHWPTYHSKNGATGNES